MTADTLTRFQVMSGWEAVAQAGQEQPGATQWLDRVTSDAVNDLGINRVRMELRAGSESNSDNWTLKRAGAISDTEWRSRRYTAINDNANPNLANPAGFHFSEIDDQIDRVVGPMRAKAIARGEHLYVSLCYLAFKTSITAVHHDVDEYAELIVEAFRHTQARYGWVPDAVEMILEPDNGTFFSDGSGSLIGQAIVAAGTRLAAAGFTPEFVAPSTLNMGTASTYFDNMIVIPGVRNYLTEISYHRYGGVTDANLGKIKARAIANGMRSAMLEHIGSGVEDLYKDLTLGHASAWQQFALAFPLNNDDSSLYYRIVNGVPVIASQTIALRQYFRYVRLGARRVGATSDKAAVRTVAFTNVGGGPVVVLHTVGPDVYAIRGLRSGRYLVTSSSLAMPSLGIGVVGLDGELRFASTNGGIVTAAWIP